MAIRRGLLTREQLRSSGWRRLRQDIYADASLPVDHGLVIAGAAVTLPASALIAGRSAAWLYSVDQALPDDPVDVLVPCRVSWRTPAGVSVHRQAIPPSDVATLGRRRLTTPARTCVDIARWYETLVAVPLIDAMLATQLVHAADLRTQLAHARGHHLNRARTTLALCDPRAESPPESVLRVRLVLAGVPAPVPQYEVRHQGTFVARVDLGWPASRVAVEYDGVWHGGPAQLARDRRRLNALVAAGWTVIHVTATDLGNLDRVIGQLTAALRKAA